MSGAGGRKDDERAELLAYALRAVSARALSAWELRRRLSRRTEDQALLEEVLARIQELGYQRDTEVAQRENSRRAIGPQRVRQIMRRRGLSEELIEETLEQRDEAQDEQAALELLHRRWASLSRKKDPRASAYAFLARRGYGGAVIWRALEALNEG